MHRYAATLLFHKARILEQKILGCNAMRVRVGTDVMSWALSHVEKKMAVYFGDSIYVEALGFSLVESKDLPPHCMDFEYEIYQAQ